MTPVQAATIPLFMQHKDTVVEVSLRPYSTELETNFADLADPILGGDWFRQDAGVCRARVGEDYPPGKASGKA